MIKNRFVLIDAFALIFRAYYGLPTKLSHNGQPIQAVYGFTSALLSAIRTLEPEYLAVGLDVGKPTYRHKEFKDYKIKRPEAPEDLKAQIPLVIELLKTMDIPTFGEAGYEGEDVIATIVANVKCQITNNKFEYIIVTGDMDTLQLIDEDVKVYSASKGVNQAMMYDEDKVKEKYGLTPNQFVDYKALRGDPSDNIPGVPGIGEKGAAKLIQEFGSIETLYKKIKKNNKISPKLITILQENKEQAFMSYKLSKIQTNAPIDFKLKDAKIHHYDKQKTIKLFEEYGFKSLISRLPEDLSKLSDSQNSTLGVDAAEQKKQQKLF